jgi:CheY-like chemotaxis protein
MDCQMPVMDGFEATRHIRQMHNGNQHVPIVAVTANTMSEDEARCYDAGMNGFVPKPINQKIVQSVLKRWLGVDAPPDSSAYTEARQS